MRINGNQNKKILSLTNSQFFNFLTRAFRFASWVQISFSVHLSSPGSDAGYGSEENLVTLDEWGIDHLMKYGLFDTEQKRSHKESSKNLDNWIYDKDSDSYTHPDGWNYHFEAIKYSKTTTGFEQEIRVYKAEYPDFAPQKGLYINERYQTLKQVETKEAFISRRQPHFQPTQS